MTPKQAEFLRYLIVAIDRHGASPNYAELAEALALKAKSGIVRLVDALVERGYVAREGGRRCRHALVVTPAGYAALGRPLLRGLSDSELHAEIERRRRTDGHAFGTSLKVLR